MATSRTFMQVTPTPSSAGSVLPFTFTWLPSLQLSTCLGLRFRRLPEWAATASRGCSSLGFSAGQNPRSCLGHCGSVLRIHDALAQRLQAELKVTQVLTGAAFPSRAFSIKRWYVPWITMDSSLTTDNCNCTLQTNPTSPVPLRHLELFSLLTLRTEIQHDCKAWSFFCGQCLRHQLELKDPFLIARLDTCLLWYSSAELPVSTGRVLSSALSASAARNWPKSGAHAGCL